MLVELGLRQGSGGLPFVPLHVEQTGDDAALHQVFADDFGHVRLGYLGVAGPLREDHDDGPLGAQAEAAGFDDADLILELMSLEFLLKGGQDFGAFRGGTAGTGAYHHMGTNMTHLSHPLTQRPRWCNRSPRCD